MDCTIEDLETQKSLDIVHCTLLSEDHPTATPEVTQPVAGQMYYTVLENESINSQLSNAQVIIKSQNATSSEKTKVNLLSHQSPGSFLDSQQLKGIIKITKVPSTGKVINLIQSTPSNGLLHVQPRTSNIFNNVKLNIDHNTPSSTTRAVKRPSASVEQYLSPTKSTKISPISRQNLETFSQEKLGIKGIEANRVKVAERDCYTPNSVLCSKNEKTAPKKIGSDPKEDGKNHCKTTAERNITTPKVLKIKPPNIPVPANINQYGDCFKTYVGLKSYGMTLLDPPCQFFRGVLKSSSGQTLAVMFGDTNLFSKLEQFPKDSIGHFAIDTTYKVIPNTTDGINNVLAIMLLFQNKVIPLWYAVTSSSSPELYKRIILEFHQYFLDWPFTSFLLNDDPELIKAVITIFPSAELYGSWYHYCISIWNEIRVNNLVEDCQSNAMLMKAVKMLMVIPFLPSPTKSLANSMVEGFEAVGEFAKKQSLPDNFQKVLDYVDLFWFNKVKCENFTIHQKRIHVLKYIEKFHINLLSFVKPDGNIWTFTNQFRNVAKEVYLEVVRYLSGKPFMEKKCPRRRQMSVPSHTNFRRLVRKHYGMETFLDNSFSYCDEFLDIILHPMYPTRTIKDNIRVHIDGWRIK